MTLTLKVKNQILYAIVLKLSYFANCCSQGADVIIKHGDLYIYDSILTNNLVCLLKPELVCICYNF